MPETYELGTKDGIVITDIPDTIKKDDPILKAMVAAMRASGQKTRTFSGAPPAAAPGPLPQTPAGAIVPASPDAVADGGASPTPGVPAAPPEEPKTDIGGLMGAAIRGAGPYALAAGTGALLGAPLAGVGAVPGALAGVGAYGLTQLVGDPLVDLINGVFGTKFERPTKALQYVFDSLGIEKADTAAERVVQAATSGAGGAAGTIALGQALASGAKTLSPSFAAALGDALSAGARQNVAGAIGGGASSQTAAELGLPPWAQFLAGIGGGAAMSHLAGKTLGPPPGKTAPIAEADTAGIDILTTDVRPPKTAFGRWVQRRTEELPFGPGRMRKAQVEQRQEAVRNVLREYGADDLSGLSSEVMDDLMRTRGDKLNSLVRQKTDVIKSLPQTGVPMPATMAKIDKAIATLDGMKTKQVKPVIDVLSDWKDAIQSQDIETVELLRKQIGEVFTAPDMASVRTTGEKILSGIYEAVNDDMGSFIKTAGGQQAYTKWRVANTELAKLARELERPALKAALEKGAETPEAVYGLLFSRKRSDVQSLYQNLSPAGRAAAKAAILAKAAGTAGPDVSPGRFADGVKRMADQTGVFFDPDDKRIVEGLVRVLDYTKHAAVATQTPPTGVQAVLPIGMMAAQSWLSDVTGSKLMGFGGAIAAGLGLGKVAQVFESKPVRDLLMKLPTVARGSPEELALVKRLLAASYVVNQKENK